MVCAGSVCTCASQQVRNVSFSENFTHVQVDDPRILSLKGLALRSSVWASFTFAQ